MTESAYSTIRGAEISERSAELVLPANGPAATILDSALDSRSDSGSDTRIDSRAAAARVDDTGASSERVSEAGSAQLGRALPGDRARRGLENGSARPSFWRRIALGRRTQTLRSAPFEDASVEPDPQSETPSGRFAAPETASAPSGALASAVATRAANEREAAELALRANQAVERRIVEPLLQALVSVEAKLERSHVDLVGRSDQVEQRLTQLWDIEEQLGALGELQETVLQVTEQQRRLEGALVAQTRILRWLVGGIILSLAVAAFAVAFFVRVSG